MTDASQAQPTDSSRASPKPGWTTKDTVAALVVVAVVVLIVALVLMRYGATGIGYR